MAFVNNIIFNDTKIILKMSHLALLSRVNDDFEKPSAAQLNKIIDETQAELTRRKNIDAATVEIRFILKKYKIDFQDIDLNIITRAGGKSSTKKRTEVKKSRD